VLKFSPPKATWPRSRTAISVLRGGTASNRRRTRSMPPCRERAEAVLHRRSHRLPRCTGDLQYRRRLATYRCKLHRCAEKPNPHQHGRGAWRDNVFVDRLWNSVKYEEVYLHTYDSVAAAKAGMQRYLFPSITAIVRTRHLIDRLPITFASTLGRSRRLHNPRSRDKCNLGRRR
jgi:hypothetical protein